MFRQENSLDKNSSLDIKKRASEASKGKRAKQAPLQIQQTHVVTHI